MTDPKEEAQVIYGFSKSLLSSKFDNPKPTPAFHLEAWEYCCDPNPRVAIAAPRGHAKTTTITHVFSLYRALFRLNDFIVILSDTETQAVQFLHDIRAELRDNDNLRKFFQVKEFEKDNERDIVVILGPDNHQFRIMARGAGTSLRGMKWRGKRPNLVIGDDLENDESVMNEERRTKFKQWVFGALLPMLSDEGIIRIAGTILHFDSLLQALMPVESDPFTVRDGLKLYSTAPIQQWKSINFRAHTDFDDFTEILWPEKFPAERLKAARQDYIIQGFPEGYSQEYLNYPISAETAFFRKEDILPMEPQDYEAKEKKQLRYYAAIDPAVSLKERRSYTAIVVAGVDPSGKLLVVDVIRARMDAKEIIDWMFSIQSKYSPEFFTIEMGAIEKSLGPHLRDEMMRGKPFINLNPLSPGKDKRSRARSIQARLRQGAVRFDTKAEWYPALFEEMVRFDRGTHDDQVDALAWIGLTLDSMIPGNTKREQEDEEYEEMTVEFSEAGRSGVTGY